MLGITFVDWLVLLLYLLGITAIDSIFWYSRQSETRRQRINRFISEAIRGASQPAGAAPQHRLRRRLLREAREPRVAWPFPGGCGG